MKEKYSILYRGLNPGLQLYALALYHWVTQHKHRTISELIYYTAGIGSHVLNEVPQVWRFRGCKYVPLPQCLHLQSILNNQGRTLLAYLLRNMSLSKQARETYISGIVGGEVFLLCTRGQCKLFVVLDTSKATHKWKIKRHYDTVLCSKSTADAATLSIFTLRHVHCGLRCATSSWADIEYMIADACIKWCGIHSEAIFWILNQSFRMWSMVESTSPVSQANSWIMNFWSVSTNMAIVCLCHLLGDY